MKCKGKTALITGGVSGIGFGIARAFSAAGIELILTYRNDDYRQRAERVVQATRPRPARVLSLWTSPTAAAGRRSPMKSVPSISWSITPG